ncbi:MAG: hypothetical protein V3U30_02870 [Thermoplasmata archaeon]
MPECARCGGPAHDESVCDGCGSPEDLCICKDRGEGEELLEASE